MSNSNNEPMFEAELRGVFDEMVELLKQKRAACGTTNLVRFGEIGIVIRASDKIDRLANLNKTGQTVSADGDSAEDAWMDLIGYGALGLLYHREQQDV